MRSWERVCEGKLVCVRFISLNYRYFHFSFGFWWSRTQRFNGLFNMESDKHATACKSHAADWCCVLWDGDRVYRRRVRDNSRSLMHCVLFHRQALHPLDPSRLFGWQSANTTGGSGRSFTRYCEEIVRDAPGFNDRSVGLLMFSRSVQRAAALLQLSARQ